MQPKFTYPCVVTVEVLPAKVKRKQVVVDVSFTYNPFFKTEVF